MKSLNMESNFRRKLNDKDIIQDIKALLSSLHVLSQYFEAVDTVCKCQKS